MKEGAGSEEAAGPAGIAEVARAAPGLLDPEPPSGRGAMVAGTVVAQSLPDESTSSASVSAASSILVLPGKVGVSGSAATASGAVSRGAPGGASGAEDGGLGEEPRDPRVERRRPASATACRAAESISRSRRRGMLQMHGSAQRAAGVARGLA